MRRMRRTRRTLRGLERAWKLSVRNRRGFERGTFTTTYGFDGMPLFCGTLYIFSFAHAFSDGSIKRRVKWSGFKRAWRLMLAGSDPSPVAFDRAEMGDNDRV